MKYTLTLVKKTDSEDYYLQSSEPSQEADFSIYDIDGEGSGSPFDFGNMEWSPVFEVASVEYESAPDDRDGFWEAQQTIVREAIAKGIPIPDYVEVW